MAELVYARHLKCRPIYGMRVRLPLDPQYFVKRGVAQLARALRLGRRGRPFESDRPDTKCGHRIMAITLPFQGRDAGSIPAARSNIFSARL